MTYERLKWMAKHYPPLLTLNQRWQLDVEDFFPTSSYIFQSYTPTDGGNVRIEVELRLGLSKVTLFAGSNPSTIRMYEEETETVHFQPSNISRIMRFFNGRNIVVRYYREEYHKNKLASAVLDAFLGLLDKHLEMVLVKVEDMDSPMSQISVKPFYADEVRYIFHSDGARIDVYYSPRKCHKDQSVMARFIRKTMPYEKLPPIDFTDPRVDPEEAMRDFIQKMVV